MEFSYQEKEKTGIFKLTGSLIGEKDGMVLIDAFNDRMEEGKENFVVALSGMKHMNSSGLGVLITLLTRTRNRGGDLVLVSPSDTILNLMRITKLDTVFKIYNSEDQAIAQLKG